MAEVSLSPESQRALDALRQAVAEALERKRRLGQYAVVWQEGRPVSVIPGDAEREQPPAKDAPSA